MSQKNILDDRVLIRNERPEDYQCVEALTRSAFYNLYIPGCVEHYLVPVSYTHLDVYKRQALSWSPVTSKVSASIPTSMIFSRKMEAI